MRRGVTVYCRLSGVQG